MAVVEEPKKFLWIDLGVACKSARVQECKVGKGARVQECKVCKSAQGVALDGGGSWGDDDDSTSARAHDDSTCARRQHESTTTAAHKVKALLTGNEEGRT